MRCPRAIRSAFLVATLTSVGLGPTTVRALAHASGISESYARKILSGKRRLTLDVAARWAAAAGLSTAAIVQLVHRARGGAQS